MPSSSPRARASESIPGCRDFRGNEGFWRAYPPLKRLGISFYDMANPIWFKRDPELAWGFYGHRLGLYRATVPHDGFRILRDWSDGCTHGSFVFTSNVDGQFQRAGFDRDRILECHGSIHHLQCLNHCGEITRADPFEVTVDDETFRATPPLPSCPRCGSLARPNVLMFGDFGWLPDRTSAQEQRFTSWISGLGDARLVIVEIGAGTAVPTVRMTSEQLARRPGATLIRINLREPQVPTDHIGIALGGLEALQKIRRANRIRPERPGPGSVPDPWPYPHRPQDRRLLLRKLAWNGSGTSMPLQVRPGPPYVGHIRARARRVGLGPPSDTFRPSDATTKSDTPKSTLNPPSIAMAAISWRPLRPRGSIR